MKHFVFGIVLFGIALTSASCAKGEKPFPFIPITSEDEYVPHEDEDPFPEYVAPTIDTSTFTLDNIPVNFTAVNDFHGQVDEEVDDKRVGLAKMSTYLKDRKAKGDILLSSGDLYQGSFLSGIDYGQFISHACKNIGFDAYTLGNHEFDWGINPLLDNELATRQNFLGANIYNYPYDANNPIKSKYGEEYKIINLYEDTPYEVKVGIIGVIGKDQISSIKSIYTSDYVFVEPTNIVKNIALKLREEDGCDFVIASYHDDEPDRSIANKVKGKSYRYVDACFMAHTHKYQHYLYNDVPFIQASAYSRGVALANFSFNKNTKSITLIDSKYQYLAELSLNEDPLMKEKLDERRNKYSKEYNNIVGVNNAGELDVGKMSEFYAKVVYDENAIAYKKTLDINIVGCYFNESRRSLKAGNFTYVDLYATHPFMDKMYILSITGKDLLARKKYSYGYLNPSSTIISDERYDVITFDYNGLHISVNDKYEKYYNYFPSAFSEDAPHKPIEVELIKKDYTCLNAALTYLEGHSIENDFFSQEGLFTKSG